LYKEQVEELQEKLASNSQSQESHRLVIQQLQEQHLRDLEDRDDAVRKAEAEVQSLSKRASELQQQLDSLTHGRVRNFSLATCRCLFVRLTTPIVCLGTASRRAADSSASSKACR
jgi:cell division septum initiation protein DivIVA